MVDKRACVAQKSAHTKFFCAFWRVGDVSTVMLIRLLNLGWLSVVTLMLDQVLAQAQIRQVADGTGQTNTFTIGWRPSPSSSVVGYALYWGFSNESCTNRIAMHNVTNVTLEGIEPNLTYCFAVAAYDATGEESPWSNLIQYSRPSIVMPGVLQLQQMNLTATNPVMRLSFTAQAGSNYRLQATEDFQRWKVLSITNCVQQQLVVYDLPYSASIPHRFFRLIEE